MDKRLGEAGLSIGSMSDELTPRIEMIFTRLFPELREAEIFRASIHSVREWDEIATLSLIVEAEDEFGISIGFESADDIESFVDLCDAVRKGFGRQAGATDPASWIN